MVAVHLAFLHLLLDLTMMVLHAFTRQIHLEHIMLGR